MLEMHVQAQRKKAICRLLQV